MILLITIGKILAAAAVIVSILSAAALLFLFFCPAVGKLPDRAARSAFEARSDHYARGRFRNRNEVRAVGGKAYPASDRRRPEKTLSSQKPSFFRETAESDLSFTWLGHSSFLLQIGGSRLLADPVLSDRCSPVSFAGPRRFSELPLRADELPEIDVLFLSHDHYDHLDYRTVLAVKDRVGTFIVPLGLDAVLTGWGVEKEKIRSLDWWESVTIGSLTCTLTPSQHFSGRDPLRGNRTLWGGLYVDDGAHRVYYTGDGGYCGVFGRVRERLGAPDLMLAECGQYDTAWPKVHMFPEETVRACTDAGASRVIPVHWGAFSICNHSWDDPVRRVTAAAAAAGLPVAVPRIGRTVDLADLADCTEPWWEAYR